jgi:hypothetical protein
MNLSAELFEAITTTIRGDSRDEKRMDPRVGLSGKVCIIPLATAVNAKPTMVNVRDLSAGGIGILHTEPFKGGQQFNLVLKYEKTGQSRMVLCTVRWSRSVGSGLHEIGASFAKSKPAAAASREKAPTTAKVSPPGPTAKRTVRLDKV